MTLIQDARAGPIDEIEQISKLEGIDPEKLRKAFLAGHIVIPKNPIHNPKPIGIGSGLRVKINVNIGTSPDHIDIDEELEKAKIAMKYGTDTIMDLSIGGDIDLVRSKILKSVDIPLGTVPIYQAGLEIARSSNGSVVDMTEDQIFNAIEKHAKDGVDFMTVHCGVTKETVNRLRTQGRITDLVSRGGAFLMAWILHNDAENPLYSNYDYLLELAQKYEFTLSLGDGLRPGSIADATDRPQLQELIILGELVDRARKADVQAMVEGPGHIPLNQIAANIHIQKTTCNNAPFYVLGPLVTDIAPGYDHIVGAIGGAIAAYNGADFLCYVTPSEHLALPTIDDVREGTIASKIAAHAADIARGFDSDLDLKVSKARKALDWDTQFSNVLDPEKAKEYRSRRRSMEREVCSMCGNLCAIKIVKDYMDDNGKSNKNKNSK